MCALAGPLFGVPSSALLRTSLSHWLSVPSSYDGLLLDARKKKKAGAPGGVSGALKRRAADVKIGPLLHASGQHNDGDPVHVTVQVRPRVHATCMHGCRESSQSSSPERSA